MLLLYCFLFLRALLLLNKPCLSILLYIVRHDTCPIRLLCNGIDPSVSASVVASTVVAVLVLSALFIIRPVLSSPVHITVRVDMFRRQVFPHSIPQCSHCPTIPFLRECPFHPSTTLNKYHHLLHLGISSSFRIKVENELSANLTHGRYILSRYSHQPQVK